MDPIDRASLCLRFEDHYIQEESVSDEKLEDVCKKNSPKNMFVNIYILVFIEVEFNLGGT
jgi:hypothetical protein